MPKQGFTNLKQEEQDKVFDAALDEFSRADFDTASLNSIIRSAGISKGSMYHYFHNKEDLYFYVLDRAMADKAHYLTDQANTLVGSRESLGFFTQIKLQIQASVSFARDYPRYQMLNAQLQKMSNSEIKGRVWERFNKGFDQYIQHMIQQAVQAGELRTDMDQVFISRILRFFLLRFSEFYDYDEAALKLDEAQIRRDISLMMDFLECGLKHKGSE